MYYFFGKNSKSNLVVEKDTAPISILVGNVSTAGRFFNK